MTKPDLRNFTRRELAGALAAAGEKPSRADKLFNCLYKKGAASFDALDLPAALKAKLAERFALEPRPAAEKKVSALDSTVKLLLRFADGAPAECVTLRNKDNLAFCLSSQSGCACGCTFCATGALGLRRSLTPAEITAQFEACRAAACRTA